MTQPVPYLLQGPNVILVINSKSHTISKDTHMNYGKIVDALKAKDWDALVELVEPARRLLILVRDMLKSKIVLCTGKMFHLTMHYRLA